MNLSGLKSVEFHLNHSFTDLGHPTRNNNASGAPQLAQRSIKSQIGSPTNGRNKAVQRPQKAIQSNANRTGLTKIKNAKAASIKPIKSSKVVAVSDPTPSSLSNQPIH